MANFKNFIKEHKFLFLANVISFVITLIYLILYFIVVYPVTQSFTDIYFYFLPLFFVIIISIIANRTFNKNPKLIKIISLLLNLFVIVFIQIFLSFGLLCVQSLFAQSPNYSDPNDYEKALTSIYYRNRIKHFPEKIPENAKNIFFNKTSNDFFGSEGAYLIFDTDKKYIDNELNKYQYISIENPHNYKHDFNGLANFEYKELTNNFTFYVINDKTSENPDSNGCNYNYGIGVKDGTIVYFYNCPD